MKEDPYGLVQRDLGTVLDSLLSSVIDVETLVRSPPPEYKKLPPGYKGDVMLMEPEFILLGKWPPPAFSNKTCLLTDSSLYYYSFTRGHLSNCDRIQGLSWPRPGEQQVPRKVATFRRV